MTIRSKRFALFAALTAITAAPAVTDAQYRVDNGNALDANNRVGSGGYNDPRPAPTITGNQIIYGNVTAGRHFRGNLPYTDPDAFRGRTAGAGLDRFVADSAGAPTQFAPRTDLTNPQPFYGESRAVAPPAGYVRQGFAGGYIPPDLGGTLTRPVLTPDARLGEVTETRTITLPAPGESALPGPVESLAQPAIAPRQPSAVTVSPLYGIRPLEPISARQTEAGDTDAQRPEPAGPNLLQPIRPLDADVGAQGMSSGLPHAPIGQGAAPEQYQRSRLLGSPAQQSEQYNQLQQRFQQRAPARALTDEEAHRQFSAQLQQRRDAAKAPVTPPSTDTVMPDETPDTPADIQPQPAPLLPPAGERPVEKTAAPIRIESLATGVKSPDLAAHLQRAEVLMREGKFASALEQYDAADELAANNPLIPLGRAHAELGGAFYVQADTHLRQALQADAALLMGIYDLRKMIGEERLNQVVTDLKQIAAGNPNQSRPVFLLAYIAYNTGSPDLAAQWLAEAERRSPEKDPVFGLLRTHWKLPTPDLNK